MAGEAASALGLSMAVLAERPDDAACSVAAEVLVGSPFVPADMRALSERCRVVTFDHEQVDLDIVASLEKDGVATRPGAATLEMAVDKAHMRSVLDAAGVPVPSYRIVDAGPGALEAVSSFATEHGWPLILKSARGGYDGKGVWSVSGPAEAEAVLGHITTQIVVEELVPLDAELAVMVARSPSGASTVWPAVETAQVDGVCREVLVPGRLDHDIVDAAAALGQKVAEIAGGGRRHGRRAVLVGRPAPGQRSRHASAQLGTLDDRGGDHIAVREPRACGARPAPRLDRGPAPAGGQRQHLRRRVGRGPGPAACPRDSPSKGRTSISMARAPEPGRKLGHVTVCGDDAEVVRSRAWTAALALGTPAPDGLTLPDGVRSAAQRGAPGGGRP